MADRVGLPFEDTADFEDAERGLVDAGEPVIRNEAGEVVWDNGSYSSFLTGDAPDSVHPSLWRQSTLVAKQGLFEVTDGIYQVRGYDLSNMSVIEGDTGIIVIDPLISAETAGQGSRVPGRSRRGQDPDHRARRFRGARDLGERLCRDGDGPPCWLHVRRRAGPRGGVGARLGQTTSTGPVTLIAPTVTITPTGQELTVDGVRMVFQMAPGTEAPAEMHFYFPDQRALCMAENATHTLHNLLT